MLYLKCIKNNGEYMLTDANNDQLQVLYFFLSGESLSFISWVKEWIYSDLNDTGGNISNFEKKGNDIILSLDPAIIDPDNAVFVSSKTNFLFIINKWEKLRKEKWDHIIITQDDNGEVHLEGKNE